MLALPRRSPRVHQVSFRHCQLELGRRQERIAAQTGSMVDALAGLPAGEVYDGGGLATFPAPGRAWSAHRTPLVEGFATESLDGAPVAPMMGDYKSYEVGVLRLRALPNFWCHASADHAVTTRLAPGWPRQDRDRGHLARRPGGRGGP